jgi:hypothetical protein
MMFCAVFKVVLKILAFVLLKRFLQLVQGYTSCLDCGKFGI